MWKNLLYYDKRKGLRRTCFWLGIWFAIIAIGLAVAVFFIQDNMRPENIRSVDLTITSFKVDKEDDETEIYVNENDHTYYINFSNMKSEDVFKTFEVGETYTFYVSVKFIDNPKIRPYMIGKTNAEGSTELLYNIIPDEELTNKVVTGIAIGAAVLAAASLSGFIAIKHRPKYGSIPALEFMFFLSYQPAIVSAKRARPYTQKETRAFIFAFLGSMLALIVAGVLMLAIGSDLWVKILGLVILVCSGLTPIPFIAVAFPGYFSRDAELFAKNYVKYIKEGVTEKETAKKITTANEDDEASEQAAEPLTPFAKEGLMDEDTVTPYSEIDFYVAAQYRNLFCAANLYIIGEKRGTDDYFAYILNPENYKAIKELGLEVHGLDDLLDNFPEHINKYRQKKKINLVLYKESGIEVRPLTCINSNYNFIHDPRKIAEIEETLQK